MPKIFPENQDALNLYSDSRLFHCLPKAGGLEDQEAKTVMQFRIITDQIEREEILKRKLE